MHLWDVLVETQQHGQQRNTQRQVVGNGSRAVSHRVSHRSKYDVKNSERDGTISKCPIGSARVENGYIVINSTGLRRVQTKQESPVIGSQR